MEPEAQEALEQWNAGMRDGATLDVTATNGGSLLSIAISLKRIADELAGVPYDHTPGADNNKNRMGVVDGIMHAIEQGLLAASQRG